jgi:hypothetical protein
MICCSATFTKASSTCSRVLAEHSAKNGILNFFASSSPSCLVTCRSCSKSFLLPTKTTGYSLKLSKSLTLMIWSTSVETYSNDEREIMEYTRKKPEASRIHWSLKLDMSASSSPPYPAHRASKSPQARRFAFYTHPRWWDRTPRSSDSS